jgi:hypothetical protein
MAEFENIQKVFGRSDYKLRTAIAQVLQNQGDNLFPKNGSCDNTVIRHRESPELDKHTCYAGQLDQNAKLTQVPVSKLQSIKDEVFKCDKDFRACIKRSPYPKE